MTNVFRSQTPNSYVSTKVESVDTVDSNGKPIGEQQLGIVLTQGWLHRAVHLAEV